MYSSFHRTRRGTLQPISVPKSCGTILNIKHRGARARDTETFFAERGEILVSFFKPLRKRFATSMGADARKHSFFAVRLAANVSLMRECVSEESKTNI